MTWDDFSNSLDPPTSVGKVNSILDRQRGYQKSLSDGDIFLSRTDLRMHIDRCRVDARTKLLELYSETHTREEETLQDLILHAAAWLQVSPLNMAQLIKDYPDLIRHHDGPRGLFPVHIAVKAVGSKHYERVEPFLDLYPEATKCLDEDGLLPLQSALLAGADYRVIQLLLDHNPDASKLLVLPESPVKEEYARYVGMLPIHVACCCSSVEVIYCLLLQCPEVLIDAGVKCQRAK